MSRFARTTLSKNHNIISIKRPFSFYNFVDNFNKLSSLRRILSQIRLLGGNTMVIEEIGKADDIDEENDDIRKCYPYFNQSKSLRLSFFTKTFSTKRGLVTADNNEFIGYVIVKTDKFSSLSEKSRTYESVIRFSRHSNNIIRGKQKWTCCVLNNEFEVDGYLYAQQNSTTNACAHVALRTAAARYHKEGDMSYREMNNLVGIDHIQKKVDEGLNVEEMVQILEAAGARCFVGNYTSESYAPVPFQKYLYGSIESGFPAIIFFGLTHVDDFHAIPVFGHTFDENAWVASADFSYFKVGTGTRYIPSESWLSTFIAHDDNWGSNFCIPRGYLNTKRICDKLEPSPKPCPIGTEEVVHVISTVPEAVKTSPIRAEVIGADYLFTILPQIPAINNPWDERLKYYAKKDMLVLRPIMVTSDNYTDHLLDVKDWERKTIRRDMIQLLKKYLQDRFYWLIELSIPELFPANRRKVGEVLIRAEKEIGPQYSRDISSFVIARLPGHFVLYESGGPLNPKYKFIPSGVSSHVELYGCEP